MVHYIKISNDALYFLYLGTIWGKSFVLKYYVMCMSMDIKKTLLAINHISAFSKAECRL